MVTKPRQRAKGRRESGTFTALPHTLFRASTKGKGQVEPPPVARLSKLARLLLVDICQQLNGRNNGDISAAPKTLAPYGWTSRGTVDKCLVELVAEGFLEQTRQGGLNRCSLYAVTWLGIDDGPHDAKPAATPSGLWKPENSGLRDLGFIRRWQQYTTKASRAAENASRTADKASRRQDKPPTLRAV